MLSLFASGPGAWKKVGESAQGRVSLAKPPRVDRPQLLAGGCCLCAAITQGCRVSGQRHTLVLGDAEGLPVSS